MENGSCEPALAEFCVTAKVGFSNSAKWLQTQLVSERVDGRLYSQI